MKLIVFNTILLIIVACKHTSINCGKECLQVEEKLFYTEFNNTLLIDAPYSKVEITDSSSSTDTITSWTEFTNHPNIGTVQLSYEDGNTNQRFAQITQDSEDINNNIIQFTIKEPHINEGTLKKGRVQCNINENNCITELSEKISFKLHKDLEYLLEWDKKVDWFTILEFWNNADWTKEKYPFRITINLFKEENSHEFMFHIKGEYKKNCKICKWHKQWEELNTEFIIPIDTWVNLELYLKEGDNNNGKIQLRASTQESEIQNIFNITNYTQHPKEKCADGFTHMQPFKLYTGEEIINYMKDAQKELTIYWDNFEFSLNTPLE
jgi:hypothetical protein